MHSPWRIPSSLPGIGWPALPSPGAATALAIQFQLERSQWLDPARVRALQMLQLEALVRHAAASVPFYADRVRPAFDRAGRFSAESFARLPLLTRSELQSGFEALTSRQIPPSHGRVATVRTSGSTGQPVQVMKTELTQRMWEAMLLREHRWFERSEIAGWPETIFPESLLEMLNRIDLP